MVLFIFENISSSELVLIGVVALILLGPRRMPEIARKLGKFMADFRGTANEFKETWRREVDFDVERKAFDLRDDDKAPVPREAAVPAAPPTIKTTDMPVPPPLPAEPNTLEPAPTTKLPSPAAAANDKRNWL